ncbi:hypothetical protein [Nocardioides insulae]|uniref:hypothetical protein n=1 Tax=Nocardioides insulae TaxID=394734 RepID=UPI0003F562DC|nr:hypothetical protein [Nocardioides insulae]
MSGFVVVATVLGGLVAAMLLAVLATAAPAHGAPDTVGRSPVMSALRGGAAPPGTIVQITGTADVGFGLRFASGRWTYPPTRSEALAECGEYASAFDRVRCRTRVRTHYRDLAVTQQALRWAR